MAFTAVDAAALIQNERSNQLLTQVQEGSKVIQAGTVVNMGTNITDMPVATAQAEAYVVDYEGTRVKPTSTLGYGSKELNARELAVIVPVREETLEDADDALIDRIVKDGAEAIYRKFDRLVTFGGADKPAQWSASLFDSATASGNLFQIGASATENDLIGQILQAQEALAAGGFDPELAFAASTLKFRLQNQRDSAGAPIYVPSFNQGLGVDGAISGMDAYFLKGRSGATPVFDRALAELLVVDPSQLYIGVRTDVQVKILDQATVNGVNLAETDQIGFRFRARFAYTLVNAEAVAAVTPAATATV